MNAARTIVSILSEPWMINSDYVIQNLPIILNLLEGKTEVFTQSNLTSLKPEKDLEELKAVQIAGASIVSPYRDPWTGTLVIPRMEEQEVVLELSVDQPITRHDNCGDYGSKTYTRLLNIAQSREDIIGVIISINSPGGMVSGTQMFADAIANMSVPTVAFVEDGYAASAAYWIASQADKIYASSKLDSIGSIGTYLTIADFSEYYKQKGITVHDIYSRLSTEKNGSYKAALDGDYAPYQDELDHITNHFIDSVKSKRTINSTIADPFKGAMYDAETALKIGLIDGIKSKAEAIGELLESNKTTFYV